MKMTSSNVHADRVFPIAGVFDDVVVSRRGALSMGWEVTWPPMFSCTEDDYDDILQHFASAFKVLPAWSVLHRQDVYTYKEWDGGERARTFLGRAYDEHFKGRRYLEHRSYLFITIAPRVTVEKAGSSSGLFGITGTVAVPSPSEFAVFRSKCSEFLAVLSTGDRLRFRPLYEKDYLGEGDTVGIIQRYMMLGNDTPVMSNIAFTPDTVSVYDKVMQAYVLGESDHVPGEVASVDRVAALSSPMNDVWLSFGARIGGLLDCEHVINQTFIIPHQDEVLRNLDKEKNRMMSGIKSVDNRVNGEQIALFLEDQYKHGMVLVRTQVSIMAWDTEDRKQELSGKLSSALRSMGCSATYNNWNTPVLYYAGIPTNAFEIGKENLMTMEMMTALCLAPYETYEPGIPGGCLRMCDRIRHIPVPMDMQARARDMGFIDNTNLFVIGGSGTGKSFFINSLARNLYDANEAVFIIDVGDSYEGSTAVIREESGGRDGIYLSWDDDHPITFNAFAGAEEWLGEDDSLRADEEGGNFFFTLVQTLCVPDGGWTSERKTVLSQTIVDYLKMCRAKGETPLFDGYYKWFDKEVLPRLTYVSGWETSNADMSDEQSAQRLVRLKEEDYKMHGYWCGNVHVTPALFDGRQFALALKDYSKDGIRGRLLNDPNPPDIFSSDYTVIEVDRLSQDDPKFYSICILCIMHALDVKMRKDTSKFKTIIIEEAWKAISNETMAPYLRGLWKTARKFNTAACVVTQEIADIVDNPVIKTAIVDNSDVKILLDQSNHANSFGPLQKVLSLTDKDRDLILSMNRNNDPDLLYKEVFVKLGASRCGVYATEVSVEEALAYESNKKKKEPLLRRAAELGSMIEAIREMAAQKKEEKQWKEKQR